MVSNEKSKVIYSYHLPVEHYEIMHVASLFQCASKITRTQASTLGRLQCQTILIVVDDLVKQFTRPHELR